MTMKLNEHFVVLSAGSLIITNKVTYFNKETI